MHLFKKYLTIFLTVSGLAFWSIAVYGYLSSDETDIKVYNCELAEISPDYPIEVRNECRKLRNGKSISA